MKYRITAEGDKNLMFLLSAAALYAGGRILEAKAEDTELKVIRTKRQTEDERLKEILEKFFESQEG